MPVDLLRARLDEQLTELRVHAEVALADTDPEGVHQLRVAVRRARAVLKTSGGFDELRAGLRWFFGRLGTLRDLDVLLMRFRGDTSGFSPDELAAFERLLHGLVEDREKALRRVTRTLRGKRYAKLLDELAAVAPSGGGEAGADLVAEIAKPHDRLRAEIAAIGTDPSDEQLHDLRILGKKLRYVAEMATGRQARALVKATRRFQDVLGEFHDACVAEERLRALTPGDLDEAFVAGRLVERERVKQLEMRAAWYSAWLAVDRRALALRE
ncbi:CHAD domain-containing protein [Actinophytocola algeriensis]|uniref:CHAD domain-containing protein n=1 Tax=Actinophytocola algeriensis TaxID=1768010 RepID=A0A7W7QE95_9PSEU|nr:CHAD domain-containing protein [Actinophytocola algeriensis]MBB4911928.1 CHAD domain-containing protein [Actinophytocola algeriensis]MBE1477580.1 CHAD domain-containing protein [Actinophytocola algeriensis]